MADDAPRPGRYRERRILATVPHDRVAFCAISPAGALIMATIRADPDDAWRALRAALSEPDTLHEKGWRVARLRVAFDGFHGGDDGE